MVKYVRKNKPQKSKETIWPQKDELRYFLFIITFAIEEPYAFLSWENWKPSNYFVKMAKFIGQKTAQQVKSFDQRKKQEHRLKGQNLTMLQWIVHVLVQKYLKDYPQVKEKLNLMRQVLNAPEEFSLNKNIQESKQNLQIIRKDIDQEQKEIFIQQ